MNIALWIALALLCIALILGVWLLLHYCTHREKRTRHMVHSIVTAEEVLDGSVFEKNQHVHFLDVRTRREFCEGYIPNAMHIDFYGEDFLEEVKRLQKDHVYVVYCRSGGRSMQAINLLQTLGFTSAYNLDGGLLAWQANGGPVVEVAQ